MALPSATAPFMLCVLVHVLTSFLSFSTPCNANPEVDALIDVKKMILHDPSNTLQSWDPLSTNPCNWKHVTCDAEDRVHTLDLVLRNLYGVLSPKIADLQSLETLLRALDLSHNEFSGQIPASVGQIKSLRLLLLKFNKLEGRVPRDGKLSSFGYLSFEGNPDLCGPVVQRECPKRSLDP